jgi:phosphate transport system protein
MPTLLQHEISKLKKNILTLGGVVEERVALAMRSLKQRDASLAEKVINGDPEIDQMEVDLEEECLKILALYQPVANDLRYIISVLKMNNDMERIGDLAVNISERSLVLAGRPAIEIPFDFDTAADKVKQMLKSSLDALVSMDPDLAAQVCRLDRDVDIIHRETYHCVQEKIRNDISQMDSLIQFLSVSRHLERIADLATNIAEDVIYMIQGRIIRHQGDILPE